MEVWRLVAGLGTGDRMTIGAQMQRAALSVACNLVEGASRESPRERLRFVEIADGSLRETGFLLDFAARVGVLAAAPAKEALALHAEAQEAMRRRRRVLARAGRLSRRGRYRNRLAARAGRG